MKPNNPIQDRMNQLLLKWTLAINTPDTKIVRLLYRDDEQDMIDTYFEYMLALDTDQEDFVMVLESPFSNLQDYGRALLEEIEEEIKQWNDAEIPESIPFETITWKADYSLGSETDPTKLLVQNLNTLAEYLVPKKEIKVSLILKSFYADRKTAYQWFALLLEHEWEPNLIFGLADSENTAVLDKLAKDYPKEVYTIVPDLNMEAAIEQLAAMGDPTAPETPYRQNLVKLMNAVEKRDAKKVERAAKACLDIATKNLEKDPNWLAQIVTVYTILYTDQVGYKQYTDAIYFAGKAVESALLTEELLDPALSHRLIGQTHVGRGTLYNLKKKRENALEDYKVAADYYNLCKDYLMQSESLRLCGTVCNKMSQNKEAVQYYLQAYYLKDKLTPDIIRGSTFPLIIRKLLESTERRKHLSDNQMNEDCRPIFGDNWKDIIEGSGTRNGKYVNTA